MDYPYLGPCTCNVHFREMWYIPMLNQRGCITIRARMANKHLKFAFVLCVLTLFEKKIISHHKIHSIVIFLVE